MNPTMNPIFSSIPAFLDAFKSCEGADVASINAARARDAMLTKPAGSLGRLEEIAAWVAGWQGSERPVMNNPQVIVFAGNHGVAARGVSAFPPEVTVQMVANFEGGGAAINQLSKAFGAKMSVVALDLDRPTQDFTQGPAMDEAAFLTALQAGWDAVDPEADMLVTGEMGIGNTTSAAAIACAILGGEPADWVGAGTGVAADGMALKAQVVAQGIAANPSVKTDKLAALRCLGGREIAAMAGAMAAARLHRIPVILDGFICSSAALALFDAAPDAMDHTIAGHQSAEAAHGKILAALGKDPLLSLGMRLGEGSGAALALGIVQGALACHSNMATFGEAGVSDAT